MKTIRFILAIFAAVALPSWASGTTTFTETFDGTLLEADWRLGTLDEIVSDGGSPGAYLRNRQLDSAVPNPVFVGPLPSPFFGDYRAARVVSLGLDVNVFSASIGVDRTRSISLVLGSDMGTPDDPSDDCQIAFPGKALPKPGSGWRSYEFKVPSDKTKLPSGGVLLGCSGLAPDDAWNAVITHVTLVQFPFSDPGIFWFFQIWDVGMDSIRITAPSR
jgi:hypothetical protein